MRDSSEWLKCMHIRAHQGSSLMTRRSEFRCTLSIALTLFFLRVRP